MSRWSRALLIAGAAGAAGVGLGLESLLESASKETMAVLAELRELGRGLRPVVLTQAGLGGAIRALVGRSQMTAAIAAMPAGRFAAPVEAAVCFVVSEALANTDMHAPGAVARIGVWQQDGQLVVQVSDDGARWRAYRGRVRVARPGRPGWGAGRRRAWLDFCKHGRASRHRLRVVRRGGQQNITLSQRRVTPARRFIGRNTTMPARSSTGIRRYTARSYLVVIAAAGIAAGTQAAATRAQAPVTRMGAAAARPALGAVRAAALWGRAVAVPGLRALNAGGFADVSSVSCWAGGCAAVGDYTDRSGHTQGFVAAGHHGVWDRAIEMPGFGALNTGGFAGVLSVSCWAGDCAAGGYYTDRSGNMHGFVAAEHNGAWRKAIEVPRLGALNAGGSAEVNSVSCRPAGDCAAGGYYTDRSGDLQGFVAVERGGSWRKAIEVPGLGALNTRGNAEVTSVSCASAGNCAAGGSYLVGSGDQGFVVVERNGSWGRAIEVPGLGALNTGNSAQVASVSCAAPGNCAAGGYYTSRSGQAQGFVALERDGAWRKPTQVPCPGILNAGGNAEVNSVSCTLPGNCAAGGDYADRSGHSQGFLASEHHGLWRTAIEVPGLGPLNTGLLAQVTSVSCAWPGNCAASGDYLDRSSNSHGFVTSERNGVWRNATEEPGRAVLGPARLGDVNSVSCDPAGECTAGGDYMDRSSHLQGFLAGGQS